MLNLGRIEQFLAAEDIWGGWTKGRGSYGRFSSHAPIWAETALQRGLKLVPKLDGRLATAKLTDYHLLALWATWKGRALRNGNEGDQLVADVESGWRDFKRWLWEMWGM